MSKVSEIKKTFVRQQDQSDCGIACLASIVNFYGGNASFDHVARLSGKDRQGTSLLGLYQAAGSLGFKPEGYEAEGVDQLWNLTTPVILHLDLDNKLQHFVVYYGRLEDQLIIGDPDKGVCKWTIKELKNKWKTKSLLTLTPNNDFAKVNFPRTNKLQWLRKMLKRDTNHLVSSLFLGLIISVLMIATAVFSQKLIDQIIPSRNIPHLILAVSLFAVVLGIRVLLDFVRGKFLITQSQNLNNRMTKGFFNDLLDLPKRFFDSKKTGDLISRLNDIRRIQTVVSNLFGNMIIRLLTAIVVIVAILVYSYQIGTLILLVLPVYIFILYKLNSRVSDSQKQVMQAHAGNESNYIDTITGIQEIKLNQSESLFKSITLDTYRFFQNKIFKFGYLKLRFNTVIDFLGVFTTLLVMSYASYLVMLNVIQVGELVAIFSLSSTIIPSIGSLILSNIQIQEAFVAFERMVEFTDTSKGYRNSNDNATKKLSGQRISIKNLSFSYPGRLELLQDISLQIQKGCFSVLFGESGSGKSTLVQLLLNFYTRNHGNIVLDDTSIDELDMKSYRKLIGVVPQEIKIFNNTLLFNIALSAKKEELIKARNWCKQNHFDKYFERIPNNYSAYLGEDGVKLSGGQKQLLALARVLYKNPEFLIIDEGTSSLDKDTEAFYLKTLTSLKEKIGVLFISHRIKTASIADNVYILEGGTISTNGTPKELMLYNNFYSECYNDLVH